MNRLREFKINKRFKPTFSHLSFLSSLLVLSLSFPSFVFYPLTPSNHTLTHLLFFFCSTISLIMTAKVDPKALVNYYFDRCTDDPSIFFCKNDKCSARCGKKKHGYKQDITKGITNLRNHLRACIGDDYEAKYLDHLNKCGGRLDGFCFTNTRDNDVFKILEWVVMRNQPLSEVDDPLTRSLFNVKPVSSKSLRSYILSLTPLVEDVIKQILPSKFCVMFDGWSDSKIHYVAIFAT